MKTWIMCIGLAWWVSVVGGRADELAPEELTPEQREQLRAEADRFKAESAGFLKAGKTADAIAMQKRELAVRDRLHQGKDHPDLARCHSNLTTLLYAAREYRDSLTHAERALAMRRRLFGTDDRAEIASTLEVMARSLAALGMHADALSRSEETLAIRERLHQGRDHTDLATSLIDTGGLLVVVGRGSEALGHFEQGTAMFERLHGGRDHPHLATALSNLGYLLNHLDRPTEAYEHYSKSLGMRERLYRGRDTFDLANSYHNMSSLLARLGRHEEALPYADKALGMLRRLSEGEDNPYVAYSLSEMGDLLRLLGQMKKALSFSQESLAMMERLHGGEDHIEVVIGMQRVGTMLLDLGRNQEALDRFEGSLAMADRLSPDLPHITKDAAFKGKGVALTHLGRLDDALGMFRESLQTVLRLHGDGDHSRTAMALHNVGVTLHDLGRDEEALPYLERALKFYMTLTADWGSSASEAEAFAFASFQPRTRDAYLTASRELAGTGPAAYGVVWRTKATMTRVLQRRHREALVAMAGSEELRTAWANLADVRRRLAGVLQAPADSSDRRDQAVRELTARKERLERRVIELLPALSEPPESDLVPGDLTARLPLGSVFVDVIRYADHTTDGSAPIPRYVAFVLTPDADPARVELGEARPIDKAVADWRSAVTAGVAGLSPAAARDLVTRAADRGAELRRRVWLPIVPHFPPGTLTVYLSPDGDLGRLPFAALPGGTPGAVLLEKYAFAQVMHGPQLLRQLTSRGEESAGTLLTVGGLEYGPGHGPLPGTDRERKRAEESWQSAGGSETTSLTGSGVGAAELRERLRSARYAHLGTHGFFKEQLHAEEWERLRTQIDNWSFGAGQPSGLVGMGFRNPLAYVGLVLSGGEILTGEGIMNLDLRGLKLAVLSACDTGLGEYAKNEGVAGLVRAFHIAGCREVVASLWKVDDEATAALMAKFYHELWVNQLPIIEALREAQLMVYRRPDLIPDLAGTRGAPKRKEALKAQATDPPQKDRSGSSPSRMPPKYWAAFTLSGVGR